jgi:hypothetical protein
MTRARDAKGCGDLRRVTGSRIVKCGFSQLRAYPGSQRHHKGNPIVEFDDPRSGSREAIVICRQDIGSLARNLMLQSLRPECALY